MRVRIGGEREGRDRELVAFECGETPVAYERGERKSTRRERVLAGSAPERVRAGRVVASERGETPVGFIG